MPFDIHTIYRHVFKVWRKRRFESFLRILQPSADDVLLDVGGYPAFWTAQAQPVQRIDTLNLHSVAWAPEQAPQHRIRTLIGDGCALEMPDRMYAIGFSNSVIEHLGSWERQERFAAEIRRVADAVWVQTPAFECPFEPHFMAPFIHYLPASWRKKLARWATPWGWIARPTREEVAVMVETTRLLRRSEMQRLFPDCEILTERLFWLLPKSYIAVRRKQTAA
jgi:hypothetical protein